MQINLKEKIIYFLFLTDLMTFVRLTHGGRMFDESAVPISQIFSCGKLPILAPKRLIFLWVEGFCSHWKLK